MTTGREFGGTAGGMTATLVGEEDPVTQRVAGVLTSHSYTIVSHHSPRDLLDRLYEPRAAAGAEEWGKHARAQEDVSGGHQGEAEDEQPALYVFNCRRPRRKAEQTSLVNALLALRKRRPWTAILVTVGDEQAHDIIKTAIASGANEVLSAGDAEIDELVWTRVQSALAKAGASPELVRGARRASSSSRTAQVGAVAVERRAAERRRGERRRTGALAVPSVPGRTAARDVVEEWEEATPADEVRAAEQRVRAALDRLPSADERSGPLADLLGISAAALRAESGRLDAKKIAQQLGTSLARVAQITPISRQALNDTPDSARAQPALDPLARILDVLSTVLPPEHVRAWLNAPHTRLGGETPIHAILDGRAERVARMLEAARDGGVD